MKKFSIHNPDKELKEIDEYLKELCGKTVDEVRARFKGWTDEEIIVELNKRLINSHKENNKLKEKVNNVSHNNIKTLKSIAKNLEIEDYRIPIQKTVIKSLRRVIRKIVNQFEESKGIKQRNPKFNLSLIDNWIDKSNKSKITEKKNVDVGPVHEYIFESGVIRKAYKQLSLTFNSQEEMDLFVEEFVMYKNWDFVVVWEFRGNKEYFNVEKLISVNEDKNQVNLQIFA